MKIILSDEEILTLVYNAFVDGGLWELESCDVMFDYKHGDYVKSRNDLIESKTKTNETLCREDVWIEIFKRNNFYFKEGNKKIEFTLSSVKQNLSSILESEENPVKMELLQLIVDSLDENGNADAFTHFNILQYMLFKEIIYG